VSSNVIVMSVDIDADDFLCWIDLESSCLHSPVYGIIIPSQFSSLAADTEPSVGRKFSPTVVTLFIARILDHSRARETEFSDFESDFDGQLGKGHEQSFEYNLRSTFVALFVS
jgi:hypothetical protein